MTTKRAVTAALAGEMKLESLDTGILEVKLESHDASAGKDVMPESHLSLVMFLVGESKQK